MVKFMTKTALLQESRHLANNKACQEWLQETAEQGLKMQGTEDLTSEARLPLC